MEDTNIDSTPATQTLTKQTMVNFFKILESGCYFSDKVADKLFGESSLLSDMCAFLPKDVRETQFGTNNEF